MRKRGAKKQHRPLTTEERLKLFDEARARQAERDAKHGPLSKSSDRGWTREELYEDRIRKG